jgi:hypothetical protein
LWLKWKWFLPSKARNTKCCLFWNNPFIQSFLKHVHGIWQ